MDAIIKQLQDSLEGTIVRFGAPEVKWTSNRGLKDFDGQRLADLLSTGLQSLVTVCRWQYISSTAITDALGVDCSYYGICPARYSFDIVDWPCWRLISHADSSTSLAILQSESSALGRNHLEKSARWWYCDRQEIKMKEG